VTTPRIAFAFVLVMWALALGTGCPPAEGGQAGGDDPASCEFPLAAYWWDGLNYHPAYPLAAQFRNATFGEWMPGTYACLLPQPH
jgi:hypothetical protein